MAKKEPLEIIHHLSRAISQAPKLEEIYEIILNELVNTFGVERASIMQLQPSRQVLKIVAAKGMDPEIWKNISIPVGEGASGNAFSKAKPLLIKTKKRDPKYKTHSYMIAPVLSFPMKVGKTPIGIINITDKKSKKPFTASDLKLLTILSDQVAAYMHLCDLLEKVKSGERAKLQLEMAHTIQQRLLPSVALNIPGVDVVGCLIPAEKVGADYYDFFTSDTGALHLCIADVSGHDVSSALLAFSLRSCMHSEAHHKENTAELVRTMNRILFKDLVQSEQFISLVYAKYQPKTKMLQYTNAGHNPPLLWSAKQKKSMWLSTEDPLLGVQPKETYHQNSCQLNVGDLLVFYTDGLTEALNSKQQYFGAERLIGIMQQNADKNVADIKAAILESWKNFSQTETPKDDVTLLIFKILS